MCNILKEEERKRLGNITWSSVIYEAISLILSLDTLAGQPSSPCPFRNSFYTQREFRFSHQGQHIPFYPSSNTKRNAGRNSRLSRSCFLFLIWNFRARRVAQDVIDLIRITEPRSRYSFCILKNNNPLGYYNTESPISKFGGFLLTIDRRGRKKMTSYARLIQLLYICLDPHNNAIWIDWKFLWVVVSSTSPVGDICGVSLPPHNSTNSNFFFYFWPL